jgi:hypothetical protein
VLRQRYHRGRPVCGSGNGGGGSVGAATADGGELVRCVQRWLTSMGEEEEQAGWDKRGYRECWL